MEKHTKTARELADMILMKLAIAGIRIDFRGDTVGWQVVASGSTPERVAQAQTEADRIAQNLRVAYDLAD
jgi:hypothetical protein